MSTSLSGLRKKLVSRSTLRAIIALAIFVLLWELGSRSREWMGSALPWIGQVPAPTAVMKAWGGLLNNAGYWKAGTSA